MARLGVTDGIRQGFLNDPIHGDFDGRGEHRQMVSRDIYWLSKRCAYGTVIRIGTGQRDCHVG